ncbi:MAG: S8 family serine peptidase [Phycisphaerae bacterium]|nr:S8 family serine peptidase [Phycisphaerae bacterium]
MAVAGDEALAGPVTGRTQGISRLDPNATIQAELHLNTSIPGAFDGADVGTAIGADTFYDIGITGENAIVSNIEAGHMWGGHESLSHVTNRTNHSTAPGTGWATPAYDRHATWVGMMMGGRQTASGSGTWQRGIAPQTDLRSGALATEWADPAYSTSFSMTGDSWVTPFTATASGVGTADAINCSWGFTDTAGVNAFTVGMDALANKNPSTTLVVSAGNSGPSANTIGAPGSGYNAITVGALRNDGENHYGSVASFSSRGPQDYGDPANGTVADVRAAVDICAPGTDLTAAYYGGQSGGNDPLLSGSSNLDGSDYYAAGLQGTSFAAPIVAGGVALMNSASRAQSLPATSRDARVIKANLLNAADKLTGWTNGQQAHPNGHGGVRTTQSLDYETGAGALNLTATHGQYLAGQTDIDGVDGGTTSQARGWDYATVGLNETTDIVIDTDLLGGSEFRATLAWFRERDMAYPSVYDDAFANLSLGIWDATFTTLYADSLSAYNSVEHLTFDLPASGRYGIRVSYPDNVFDYVDLAEEQFAVAWSGTAVPEPATLGLLAMGGLAMLRRRGRRVR